MNFSMQTPVLPVRFARLLKSAVAGLCCALSAAAVAQTFPSRPVHIIVPYTSGTGADVVTRLMSKSLSERLRVPVVIENKPGAGAALGVRALKDAKPDGYTVGILVSANAIQPWIRKDVPFDVRKDFMPITLLYAGPLVMTVANDFPARSLPEFIDYARKNRVNFGSAGAGSTSHLVPEMLKQAAGVPMTHIPFKGSPEVYTAMLGGSVQTFFDNYTTPKGMVEAGKLRVLGITSAKRVPWLPNVPTVAETYPGFEAYFWTGFAAPAGTPKDAFDKLATEIRAVLQLPEIRSRLVDMGLEPGGNSPAEFQRFIDNEYAKWGKVIQEAGLKPQ